MFQVVVYILATIGALVVLAVLTIGVAYIVLLSRLNNRMRETVAEVEDLLSDSIQAAAKQANLSGDDTVPPMRIHLESVPAQFNSDLERRIADWLTTHSFTPVGVFVIEELASERLHVFLSDDQMLVAAIRFPPGSQEPYVEFCFDLGDRQRGGVSNPPDSTLLLPPDAVGRFFRGNLGHDFELLSRMWLEAKELVDHHEVTRVAEEQIAEFFEDAHAAEMDCRIKAGGLSESEIRETFQGQGVVPTEEEINSIQQRWQDAIEDHLLEYSTRARNYFHSGGNVLFVHEGSIKRFLIERLQSLLTSVADYAEVSIEENDRLHTELSELLDRFDPREAIARFRPLLPSKLRYELVDQIQTPLQADVYVLPFQ